jgi:hypothetical protein
MPLPPLFLNYKIPNPCDKKSKKFNKKIKLLNPFTGRLFRVLHYRLAGDVPAAPYQAESLNQTGVCQDRDCRFLDDDYVFRF